LKSDDGCRGSAEHDRSQGWDDGWDICGLVVRYVVLSFILSCAYASALYRPIKFSFPTSLCYISSVTNRSFHVAVSFPALSTRIRFLRIPKLAFFIGKHFGTGMCLSIADALVTEHLRELNCRSAGHTGVILSTAFCHLLQEGMESLMSPEVKKYWPKVGQWRGIIMYVAIFWHVPSTDTAFHHISFSSTALTPKVDNNTDFPPCVHSLASLLLIFLIEYLSSSYVDHLHSLPPPPSYSASGSLSPESKPSPSSSSPHSPGLLPASSLSLSRNVPTVATERTPLLPSVTLDPADADADAGGEAGSEARRVGGQRASLPSTQSVPDIRNTQIQPYTAATSAFPHSHHSTSHNHHHPPPSPRFSTYSHSHSLRPPQPTTAPAIGGNQDPSQYL
jgi:hypothetical protein